MFERNGGARPWQNQLSGTPEQVVEKMRPFGGIGFRHFIVGFPAPYRRRVDGAPHRPRSSPSSRAAERTTDAGHPPRRRHGRHEARPRLRDAGRAVELTVDRERRPTTPRSTGCSCAPTSTRCSTRWPGSSTRERGWGVAGDTRTGARDVRALRRADLVHGRRRRPGHARPPQPACCATAPRLTDATAAMASALGISARILPATDDRVAHADRDRRRRPRVPGLLRSAAPGARGPRRPLLGRPPTPTPAALDAIADAELVVIGPSNPIVSIGPILALPGVREAVAAAARRGRGQPDHRRARRSRGPPTGCWPRSATSRRALGVARAVRRPRRSLRHRRGRCRPRPAIESEHGDAVSVLPTVMRTDADRAALAEALIGEAR